VINAFFLILVLASACFAEGPRYKHKDPALNNEVINIYQDIRNRAISTATASGSDVTYSSMSVSYLGISSSTVVPSTITFSSVTISNYLHYLGTSVVFGVGPVTGSTVTPVSGGGLSAQTWYWKVYPITKDGIVGSPSGMASMVAGDPNLSGRISWNLTEGASYYAITRHSAQQGPDGYSTSSVVSSGFGVFVDTGGALINGNPWSGNFSSTAAIFNTAIAVPASNGGYYFMDYVSGRINGYIGTTSAGEMVLYPGYGGTFPGVHFADQFERQMILFQRGTIDESPTTSTSSIKVITYNDSLNAGDLYVVAKSSVVIIGDSPDSTNRWVFRKSGLDSAPGKSLTLYNASYNAASSISNPGPTNERWMYLNYGQDFNISHQGTKQFTMTSSSAGFVVPVTISTGGIADAANSMLLYATGTVVNLKANTTATPAPTGMKDEYRFTNRTSAITHSGTNVWSNVTSTTISAGVWEVTGVGCINTSGATMTYIQYAISTGSGTTTTDHVAGANNLGGHPASSGTPDTCIPIPSYRMMVTTETEIFTKIQAGYSGGTPTIYGSIRAWRK
jgi:hypothetical protein